MRIVCKKGTSNLQDGNCVKEYQLNRAEPREVRIFLKTKGESTKHSYLSPQEPREPF